MKKLLYMRLIHISSHHAKNQSYIDNARVTQDPSRVERTTSLRMDETRTTD